MSSSTKYTHSEEKIDSVFKTTTKASIMGAGQGATFSVPMHLILHRFSPWFRNLRIPLKWAFHVICIGGASAWKGEASVSEYKRDMGALMRLKREKMIADAAERGVFIEE